MRFALVALLFAAGCETTSPWEASCNAPAHVTYSCAPSPAGSLGCMGGPAWTSSSGEIHHENPDLVFAVGCRAELPECSPYYQGSTRTQSCEPGFATDDGGVAMPFWVEPL